MIPVTGSPFATGSAPYSVAVDPTCKFAYVANEGSNSVSAYIIDTATGALMSVTGSPFEITAIVATSVYPVVGVCPVSVAVDPTGKFTYVLTSCSDYVWAYTINTTTGALTKGLPFVTGSSPMSVAVDPSGKFVYVANYNSYKNGYNDGTVSAYIIDANTGALTEVIGSPFVAGTYPYSVAVDPTGKFAYVANSTSNNVSAFTIDATTGALTLVAGSPFAAGTSPYSVAVDPMGKFAYVVNNGSDNVSAYAIDATTGILTEVAGSPFAIATSP